jgi:hypothetical protein
MQEATLTQMEDLQASDEYAQYIMEFGSGERLICNGDTLLCAMEDGYLFEEFAAAKGLTLP